MVAFIVSCGYCIVLFPHQEKSVKKINQHPQLYKTLFGGYAVKVKVFIVNKWGEVLLRLLVNVIAEG